MMRTVYVAMTHKAVRELEDWDPAKSWFGSDRRIHPDESPRIAGSNSVAHLDPLCGALHSRAGGSTRSVAARIVNDEAVLLRRVGAARIRLCANCRLHDQTPIDEQLWRKEALCAPQNRPESADHIDWLHLHDATQKERQANTRAAQQICRNCPVISECLDFSLSAGMTYGTWGGISAPKRTSQGVLATYRREAV